MNLLKKWARALCLFSLVVSAFFVTEGSFAQNLECKGALATLANQSGALEMMLAKDGKTAGFGGPNCYDTAFLATGLFDKSVVRYVHTTEFEFILKNFYHQKNTPPVRGDIVLYDPARDRDHVAVYLGDGKVFHKQEPQRKYPYRILKLEDVYKRDPAIRVNPFDDDGGGFSDAEKGSGPYAVYERDQNRPALPMPESKQDQIFVSLVQTLEQETLQSAPRWEVPKRMGQFSEEIINDLKAHYKQAEASDNLMVRWSWLKLESLYWQVFTSIEETSFGSAQSGDRAAKTLRAVFLGDRDFLFKVFELEAGLLGKTLTPAQKETLVSQLEAADPSRPPSLISLIKKI